MKKAYCDCCGEEITAENIFSEFKVDIKGVDFHVKINNAIPVDYDACKYCVLDEINKLDDRPAPPTNPALKHVATIEVPDPYDERDGLWLSQESRTALNDLAAGTRLYIKLGE